jgi:hypothetical protein
MPQRFNVIPLFPTLDWHSNWFLLRCRAFNQRDQSEFI